MAASLAHVLAHLHHWVPPRLEAFSDGVLLERFVQGRDESAFAALVARYGMMVLRSCRRVLGDDHAAEDAFQATFLILARKAHSLRRPDALPGYLHSIARRVALKARTKAAAHANQASLPDDLPDAQRDPLARLTARELLTVLEEEVAHLPKAQRSAVVLCCLEGSTQEEAARLLGWTAGSLRGHLERGRNRLQDRLRRRGITLTAALAVAAVSRSESMPALLLHSTVKAALGGGIGGFPAVLAQSVLQRMFVSKLAAATVALTMALAASAAVALTYRAAIAEPADDKSPIVPVARKNADASKAAAVDRFDDPLPPHAVARFGTVRFRHDWTLFATAISPDGRLLAGGSGRVVQIWDAQTGRTVQRLPLPELRSRALALAFTPDGKSLASFETAAVPTGIKGRSDLIGRLRITDVATGKTVRQFDRAKTRARTKTYGPSHLAYLAGGKQLLLRDQRESVVHLLDARSGEEIRTFRGEEEQLESFAESPDGRLLAVGEKTGVVRIWEIATGKEHFTLKEHPFSCGALAFSPDSKILASGDTIGVVRLWDVATGKVLHALNPKYDQGSDEWFGIESLSFAPDGKSVLASYRYWIVFWDAATGKEIRHLPRLRFSEPRYLPDGKTLVAKGGNSFCFLDVATGKPCRSFDGHGASVEALAYSPDGKYIATNDEGTPPELRIWEVSSGRAVLQNLIRGTAHMTSLSFSPKSDVLATAHWNTITLWDLKTQKPRRTLPNYQAAVFGSLTFSTDGTKLACAGQDDSIRVWDVTGGKELLNLHVGVKDAHPISVRDVAFSPDLDLAAYGDWSAKAIRLWDLSTGKVCKSIQRGGVGLLNVAFSPDGRTLLEVSEGGRKMYLWEVATGRLRRAVPLASFPHWDAAFSPDGHRLALSQDSENVKGAGRSPFIWIFDLASNRPPAKLSGHEGQINVLKFSPDSRFLASGSSDTTVLLWDIAGLGLDAPPPRLTPDQRAACWNDLAGDAERAYAALWKIVNDPGSLDLLHEKVKPAPAAADAKMVAQLLANLDSEQFAVRSKAQEQLANLGVAAEGQLHSALAGKTSLELRKRVEVLLDAIESERLRTRRAIEALELINSTSARELLQTLADGPAAAWITQEAKASLGRMKLRLARK